MPTGVFVNLDGRGAVYRQLYRAVREAVLGGRLPPGSRLPASRTLADELGISRTTVTLAYEQLRAEGYVEGRRRAGTFVCRRLPDEMLRTRPRHEPDAPAVAPVRIGLSRAGRRHHRVGRDRRDRSSRAPVRIDFRFGDLDPADFPARTWRRLARRHEVMDRVRYTDPAGLPELRGAVAAYLDRSRGVRAHADQVIITTGAQQAIDLLATVTLGPGQGVVIEEPHYDGARHAFAGRGAQLVPVEVDVEGLRTDRLPGRRGIRAAYVTPSHQFPQGAVLSLERRLGLLRWARTHRALVIEDDYDGEFQYGVRPIEALQRLDRRGVVAYVGSFSKTLSPAIRIGYVVVPASLRDAVIGAKIVADRFTPTAVQPVLASFLTEGHYEQHLRRVRRRLKSRRAAVLESLASHLGSAVHVSGCKAGLSVAVHVHGLPASRSAALVRRVREQGVGVYSMARYYLRPPTHTALLLGYGALSSEQIAEGIEILGRALRR